MKVSFRFTKRSVSFTVSTGWRAFWLVSVSPFGHWPNKAAHVKGWRSEAWMLWPFAVIRVR